MVEAVDSNPSQEYQAKYQILKDLLNEADRRHFQNGTETLVIELNPPLLRQQFESDEIIHLRHFTTMRNDGYVIELSEEIILSPERALLYHLPDALNDFAAMAYRGYSISFDDSDSSKEVLKAVIEKRAFAIVSKFLSESAESPNISQSTTINSEG